MFRTAPACTLSGTSTRTADLPTAHGRGVWKGKLARTSLCFAALLVTTEWGARWMDRVTTDGEPALPKILRTDPELGGTLIPGLVHVGVANQFTINRWGFRGAAVPEVKPPGTKRIAVLGDSTTAAFEGIDDDSVWVARMAAELNTDGGSNHYDAINAAVPGKALGPIVRYLDKRVGRFSPDVVVVLSVANDIVRDGALQFGRASSPSSPAIESPLRSFLLRHSALARGVSSLAEKVHHRCFPSLRHDRLDDRAIAAYRERLERLRALCRRRGWRLVICTAPRLFGDPDAASDQQALAATAMAGDNGISLVGFNDAFERYNEAIRRFAREADIPLVDLDRIVPKREAFFRDALHFNVRGHALVARSVAEVVRGLCTEHEAHPETR